MTKYSEDQIIKTRLKYLKEHYKLKDGSSKFDTVKELCEVFDISKKTLYKWRNRYEKSGKDPRSLLNRSTAPKTSPRRPPKFLVNSGFQVPTNSTNSGRILPISFNPTPFLL